MISNPYLTEFQTRPKDEYGFDYQIRTELTRKYSWAIPTHEALNIIKQYSPIIEIGAGTGYWAKMLEDIGCDILPIDTNPPTLGENLFGHKIEYTSIIKSGIDVIKLFPDCNIFLCWLYMDPTAFEVAKLLKVNRHLIYIGEGQCGCNANDDFFEYLSSNFTEVVSCGIPQWYGIHDSLTVYRKVK